MRSLTVRVSVVVAGLAAMVAFCLCGAAVAAPSAELSAALDKKLPDVNQNDSTLHAQVQGLLSRAYESGLSHNVRIGIEYEDDRIVPRGNLCVRNGTMREQLDAIASVAGYMWQADGDWINLIPKGKQNEPSYPLNQVMEGDVVVSRASSVATPVKGWFAQRGISAVRDLHALRIKGVQKTLGLDPIVLHNPTLREYRNARERMYGNNMWTNRVRLLPRKEGESIQRTVLIEWSQSTTMLVDSRKK